MLFAVSALFIFNNAVATTQLQHVVFTIKTQINSPEKAAATGMLHTKVAYLSSSNEKITKEFEKYVIDIPQSFNFETIPGSFTIVNMHITYWTKSYNILKFSAANINILNPLTNQENLTYQQI